MISVLLQYLSIRATPGLVQEPIDFLLKVRTHLSPADRRIEGRRARRGNSVAAWKRRTPESFTQPNLIWHCIRGDSHIHITSAVFSDFGEFSSVCMS